MSSESRNSLLVFYELLFSAHHGVLPAMLCNEVIQAPPSGWFELEYYGWPAWSRIKEVGVREYNYEADVRDLQIAKDEAAVAAEDFYEKNWPFQTDDTSAQYEELQFTAVIMLAEFEQFAQQGSAKRSR
jgi:hypothetical protein